MESQLLKPERIQTRKVSQSKLLLQWFKHFKRSGEAGTKVSIIEAVRFSCSAP